MRSTRVPQYPPGFGKSYALLSADPAADTAVIFVHGFGGNPTSTWRDFHGLADEYSSEYGWWAVSDMFFFSYDSLHVPIRKNAKRLDDFVEAVWNGKWIDQNVGPRRNYKHLILAGHSEGGVVIRRMVLDRFEAIKKTVENQHRGANPDILKATITSALQSDFVMTSSLRLFAPACMGTNFSSWVGFLTSFSLFLSAVAASALVRNELLAGSPVLTMLQTGTETAHSNFCDVRSLYTQPIFGVPDQIVFSESYQGEEPLWDEGYDHFSICKPDYTHKRPLEFVRK